jgi:uncharacterized DUF497 family protein
MQKLTDFTWRDDKNEINIKKHGVSFSEAQAAFRDPSRVIAYDDKHSSAGEKRFFCYGIVNGKVLTVRFVYRNNQIRIFGAGFWRQGRKIYHENQ